MAGCSTSVSLPLADWPEVDQTLWSQALVSDDLDLRPPPLSQWPTHHQEAARRHYGAWLKYVADTEPASLAEAPADRMSRSRFAAYLRHLRSRVALNSVARSLCDFHGIMESIADDRDWRWIRRLIRAAYAEAATQPKKPKQFVHATELARVGEDLIRSAYATDGQLVDPVAFRDGLIILMLIMIPVRISQFSRVEADKHLLWKEGSNWAAHWDAAETKSRRDDDHPICPELAEVLSVYLREVRPALRSAGKSSDGPDTIWVGNNGVSVGSQTLRKIIKARTAVALGRAVNPHAFRHSIATIYAIEMPERAMEAAALLSHTSFETTERYYLLGRRAKALRVALAALDACRRRHRSHTFAPSQGEQDTQEAT